MPTAGISDQHQLLDRLVNEYSRLAPTHLTGTSDGNLTSAWLLRQLTELSDAYAVQEQHFAIEPEPWLPRGFGESGCDLSLDGVSVPCYPVHRLPMKLEPLKDVAMEQVAILEDAGYELSASDVAAGVAPGSAAVIVINSWGGNRTTQPRPCDRALRPRTLAHRFGTSSRAPLT